MDDHLQGWPLQGGATTEQYNPYQCLWIKGWQLWQSSCRSALERLLLDSMETSLQLSILYFYFISQQLQFCLTRLPVLFDKQYINAVFLYSESNAMQCCHQHAILETTKGKKDIWNDKHDVSRAANAMHAWQLPSRAPNRVLITRKIILLTSIQSS